MFYYDFVKWFRRYDKFYYFLSNKQESKKLIRNVLEVDPIIKIQIENIEQFCFTLR